VTAGGTWIVVGLGNPGRRYRQTRHNIGVWAVERFACRVNAGVWSEDPFLFYACAALEGCRVVLAKPTVWMNNSGVAVAHAVARWGAPIEQTVIVCDDAALPDGRLRLRRRGTAGGHKGLLSVIQHLETDSFPRLRVGIGSGRAAGEELRDYVLEELSRDEITRYGAAAEQAAEALEMLIERGFAQTMTVFNQSLPDQADSPAETKKPEPNLGGVE
jgi:PTH1 family peptidyl-tRNA hydrolase